MTTQELSSCEIAASLAHDPNELDNYLLCLAKDLGNLIIDFGFSDGLAKEYLQTYLRFGGEIRLTSKKLQRRWPGDFPRTTAENFPNHVLNVRYKGRADCKTDSMGSVQPICYL